MCDDNMHKHQIDTFSNDIINCCIDTGVINDSTSENNILVK